MSRRYEMRRIILNDLPAYKRGRNKPGGIYMFATPEIPHMSEKLIAGLNLEAHRWTVGDKFYKLADMYYNDPKLWWVIALFNKLPTEGHVELGDLIYIPLPLDKVLRLYGV